MLSPETKYPYKVLSFLFDLGFSNSIIFVCVCVCVCLDTQLCPTLCSAMDCSPPGASVHGIFQARILELVAISPSRGSSQSRDWTCASCISSTGRRFLYHCATGVFANISLCSREKSPKLYSLGGSLNFGGINLLSQYILAFTITRWTFFLLTLPHHFQYLTYVNFIAVLSATN